MKITLFQLFGGDRGSDGKSAMNSPTNTQPLSSLCDEPNEKPAIAWRELISFWIFGLCTEFGYVVMICAAYDILSRFDNVRFQHLF